MLALLATVVCILFMVSAQTSNDVVAVTSCLGLKKELEKPFPETLILTSSLRCFASEWFEPVFVTANKTLRSDQSENLPVLDLRELDLGIVVESGELRLNGLVLPDHSTKSQEEFELSFVQVMEHGALSILQSFVLHEHCPEDISKSLQTNEHTFVCGTRFECETRRREVYPIDNEMESGCQSFQGVYPLYPSQNRSDDPLITKMPVLVSFICFLILIVLGIVIILWHRKTVTASYDIEKTRPSFQSCAARDDTPFPSRIIHIDDLSVDLDQRLGVGGFGTVYEGQFQNKKAAVKVIVLNDMPEGMDVTSEADISTKLSHLNVVGCYTTRKVQLKDLFGSQHSHGDDDCLLLFMEYCDKGELSRAIDRGEYVLNFHSLQPNMCAILHCALDIAKGLEYLHNMDLVHGDIKPDNILRKSDAVDPRGYICKICDFGLSKRVDNVVCESNAMGMISYMPPEMLRQGILGRFTDAYSFGMLLWEMVTSDVPYSEVDYDQILKEAVHGRRPKIPESTQPTIARLIEACWNCNYEQRPSANKIVMWLLQALSEWYASFPEPSTFSPSIRNSRSSWGSEGLFQEPFAAHPDALRSYTLTNTKESRCYMIRSYSTQACTEFPQESVSDETSERETELPCVEITPLSRGDKGCVDGNRSTSKESVLTSVHVDSYPSP